MLRSRFLLPAAVLLAALSLLVNRSPAYDVWTWLLWGREIAHGDMVNQRCGQARAVRAVRLVGALPGT